MNIREFNKLLVVVLTAVLLVYILTRTLSTECFQPLELLVAYFILVYDLLWEIFDLISK